MFPCVWVATLATHVFLGRREHGFHHHIVMCFCMGIYAVHISRCYACEFLLGFLLVTWCWHLKMSKYTTAESITNRCVHIVWRWADHLSSDGLGELIGHKSIIRSSQGWASELCDIPHGTLVVPLALILTLTLHLQFIFLYSYMILLALHFVSLVLLLWMQDMGLARPWSVLHGLRKPMSPLCGCSVESSPLAQ